MCFVGIKNWTQKNIIVRRIEKDIQNVQLLTGTTILLLPLLLLLLLLRTNAKTTRSTHPLSTKRLRRVSRRPRKVRRELMLFYVNL